MPTVTRKLKSRFEKKINLKIRITFLTIFSRNNPASEPKEKSSMACTSASLSNARGERWTLGSASARSACCGMLFQVRAAPSGHEGRARRALSGVGEPQAPASHTLRTHGVRIK